MIANTIFGFQLINKLTNGSDKFEATRPGFTPRIYLSSGLTNEAENISAGRSACRHEVLRLGYKILLAIISILLFQSQVTAQSSLPIQRITGPITLDGWNHENAWQTIDPLPVIQQEPNYGAEPSERTEIRIAYDDDYLYVSANCYDNEPAKIQHPSLKRDELSLTNDWFGIILDTFNDKENALAFFTTPSGLRLDMTVFDDAQGDFPLNQSWNTFWDVATQKNDSGWFVEMRIPLSSLRFQEENGQVRMGLITWRWIARKYEVVLFPDIPARWGFWSKFKSSQAQEITFSGLKRRKPLYIVPYLLGGYSQNHELKSDETAYRRDDQFKRELGLDVKYGLTSNLTLDMTVNTDFAQVEADDQQINLTRFSLFFPEKRLFFQERSSNFDFIFSGNNRLFYSRRIGIHDNQFVRIYGGGRMVGRHGAWDIGLLTMQTAKIDTLSSENFGILRLRRQVINPNTYIGGIITNRLGLDGSYNRAYGFDGIFRLWDDDYLSLRWAQTFQSDQNNDPLSLNPARFRVNWERRTLKGLGYEASISGAGKHYNPGIGYEQRENYHRFDGKLLYGWVPGETSKLLRHQIFLDGFLVKSNARDRTESIQIGPEWEFILKSGFNGSLEMKYYYEDVPDSFSLSKDTDILPGPYEFYALDGYFSTPFSGLFYTEGNFSYGSFYDGKRLFIGISPIWNLSSHWNLSAYYGFNHLDFDHRRQSLSVHIARLRALFMINTKLSLSAFVQYNSARNLIVTNFRFRYNPREGNDFYLVYDEGMNTDRHRELPTLPGSMNRTLLLKYSYTFNF